jgi:hypothetical protein
VNVLRLAVEARFLSTQTQTDRPIRDALITNLTSLTVAYIDTAETYKPTWIVTFLTTQ